MKTLLALLLSLAIFSGIFYYIFNRYAKLPSILTQDIAKTIYKFPDASAWQIKNQKNFCLPSPENCQQPVKITFETQKKWGEIYSFYRGQMIADGWVTKSIIVTSIPTSIVFTNNSNCKAELSKKNPLLSFVQNELFNIYSFSVTCPEESES